MASQLTVAPFARPTSISIGPHSFEAIGGGTMRTATGAAWASATWPTTNLAILYPFRLALPTTFRSFWILNGSAVSGNFDIAVYDDGGGTSTVNRLASSGSTAQAGTSAPQIVASTFTLPAGNFYMALCFDNTTATMQAKSSGLASTLSGFGYAQVANGAVTLGSTLTLAANAQTYISMFGISQKGAI